MSIQAILNNKGADVIAIESDQTVAQALQVMDKKAIGALVVGGDGQTCSGIFTERDVMRALAQHGAKALEESVCEHMTERPQSIAPTSGIDEAMSIMTQRRFRHLPVMTGDDLCGIVSIGDLVNYRIQQTEREAAAMKDYIATG
ncbi:MAG: CBS domain-containing protein [Alphaproteobacteria bacterium]|jgi:CBS domain-containing protein|nr:CBS domain-containing protein [Alphaproteobacteria bacterium]